MHVVWKPQPHRLITDWLMLMMPASPGDDKAPSSDQKSFQALFTITRGRKRTSPAGRYRPAKVWKPQPYWLIYGWPAEAHGASARRQLPTGATARSVRTRGRQFRIPYQKPFSLFTTLTPRGRKRSSPGSIPFPHGVDTPSPSADC